MKPYLTFIPKAVTACLPVDLAAFHLPPYKSIILQLLHVLGPICVLLPLWRGVSGKGDLLFVSLAKTQRGAKSFAWIVDANTLATPSLASGILNVNSLEDRTDVHSSV